MSSELSNQKSNPEERQDRRGEPTRAEGSHAAVDSGAPGGETDLSDVRLPGAAAAGGTDLSDERLPIADDSEPPNPDAPKGIDGWGATRPRAEWRHLDCSTLPARGKAPGKFVFSRSEDDRDVTRAEGWVVDKTGTRRGTKEQQLQGELQERFDSDPRSLDASHLVAHMLGGQGRENLVMMLSRFNRSYVGSVEGAVRERLGSGDLYYRVSVEPGLEPQAPTSVRHEVLVRDPQDPTKVNQVMDVTTRLDWRAGPDTPEQARAKGEELPTLAQVLARYDLTCREWLGDGHPPREQMH